ncbi:carboxylesterase 1-like [Chenopodium quinoa]|uniref:Alpha/beta hydrolase fold-3 domain-containing protein n=1 Tax=Chenopodium quinoa TaxID=63459 RepID=A0A803M0M1_CHEQI|nr:carboxylesterase 1-like [Chenopodium quinoa]
MASEEEKSTPICTVDPYQYLQSKLNPDGTLTRYLDVPSTPATPDPNSSSSVLTKDFTLNSTYNTYVRVFLPKSALSDPSRKLPIVVYYHGGGFVLLHVDSFYNHDICCALALYASVIVVSVEYRLAPEHRLPAAYDDAMDAVKWVRASVVNKEHSTSDPTDEWLSKYGDISNCFLMGTSAGGNIAYQTALRASYLIDDLHPLKFKGAILHHPYFGGPQRTGSELRLINDPYLPLSGNDLFWELSLPEGASRDHEFCNPLSGLAGDGLGRIERIKKMGLRVLVTECSGDPLVDRISEFVTVLENIGVNVKGHFTEGDYHGVDILDQKKCKELLVVIHDFINSCLNA